MKKRYEYKGIEFYVEAKLGKHTFIPDATSITFNFLIKDTLTCNYNIVLTDETSIYTKNEVKNLLASFIDRCHYYLDVELSNESVLADLGFAKHYNVVVNK